MKKLNLIDIAAAWLILLFSYTALSKLADISEFHEILGEMAGISGVAWPLAFAIPLIELSISAMFFWPRLQHRAFLCSTLLLTAFTCYLAALMIFASDRPCSCGGVLQSLTWGQHILLNILSIVMAIAGFFLKRNQNVYCNKSGAAENLLTE